MVQTLQPVALGLIVTWPTLSTLTVALRVWSRLLMRKFYWDDALIILAWLLAVAECGIAYNFTLLTYQGYHYYDIPKLPIEQQIRGQKFNLANQGTYIPILGLVKASVIIFLWRLEDPRRRIRLALAIFFVFNLCLTVACFFSDLFQCSPMHYFWNSPRMDTVVDGEVIERGGSCIDQLTFYMIQSGLAVLTDILILLIPPAMMWNLRMRTRKKVAVWAVLSLGWIVTVVGITRIVLYYYRFQPDNIDRSYSVAYTISIMEANVAIMASCGPALKALFTRYVSQMFGSRNATETRGNVHYCPRDYEPSSNRVRSAYSQQMRSWNSKTGRTRDMQYGMEILESIERDNDVESQEPIVRSESVQTDKSGFDFGRSGKGISRPEMAAYSSSPRPA